MSEPRYVTRVDPGNGHVEVIRMPQVNEWDELRHRLAVLALQHITQLGRWASVIRATTAQEFDRIRDDWQAQMRRRTEGP